MKKIVVFVLLLILVAIGVLFLLNGSSNYDSSKYSLSIAPDGKDLAVGSKIEFVLPDQFGKSHKLETGTQKLIFAFTKDTGHIIKSYMLDKKDGFLDSKNAAIVADISGMPVIIQNSFALPDLRKSNYKMMLIYDKDMAIRLKSGRDEKKIIIMKLDANVVKSIEFASTVAELDKHIK